MPRNKTILKGEVVITMDSRDKICIELTDTAARVRCVEIELDPADFANALMHRPSPCQFEWNPQQVGKRQEYKTEKVPFKYTYQRDAQFEADVDKALLPFEVDGWKARRADVGNHRCKTEDGSTEQETYLVHFYRWVTIP